MKELNSNPEVANVRDNNLKDCCESSSTSCCGIRAF